jgi:hypothetical protein
MYEVNLPAATRDRQNSGNLQPGFSVPLITTTLYQQVWPAQIFKGASFCRRTAFSSGWAIAKAAAGSTRPRIR